MNFCLSRLSCRKKSSSNLSLLVAFWRAYWSAGKWMFLMAYCRPQRAFSVRMYSGRVSLISGRQRARAALELAHHFAGDASVDEFFGAGVDSRETALQVGAFRQGSVHLRVHHVEFSVEERGFSEEDENGVRHQLGIVPLDAFEEYHLHLAGIVFHDDAEALYGVLELFVSGRDYAAGGAVHCTAYDPGFYLNIGLFAGDFGDAVEAAAVDVAIGVDAEQLAHCGHAQFRLDECRSFGPHPGDVLYVAGQVAHGVKIVIFRQKDSRGRDRSPCFEGDLP